jgi:transglutaminase-like putative cysteine protease
LHRAGTLATANREIAFVVTARNGDGSAKTDLPAEQLWRGRSFSNYESGKWQPQTVLKWLVLNPARGGLPPDDAEPQTTLEFEWKAKKRDAVLATPLSWQPDRVAPVSSSTPYGRIVWSQSPDGFFYPVTKDSFGKYRQALGGVPEPNLSTLFELVRPQNDRIFDLDPYREFEILTRCDLPNVKDYARSLIARLVRVGKLPAGLTDRLDPVARTVPIDDQEAVARAFRDFIADSGEFTYDVKSPPTPKDVDPIDDFLTARKGGTCERFATALAQLLRAVGIPARIVIGFKGCEHDGNGRYLIRQENAHAWCEVLIRRPTPATYHSATEPRPPHLFGWLNLDPTPSDGEADGTAAGLVGQVQSVWQSLGDWFASFVSKYNPEQRERLWNSVSSWLARWWPSAVVLAGIVGVIVAIGRLVRRARMTKVVPVRPASSLPEWYERFLAWADRRGTPRRMVETPLEHARRIGNAPALRIAGWITALRYGGVAPNADDVESVLGELEQTPLATPSP